MSGPRAPFYLRPKIMVARLSRVPCLAELLIYPLFFMTCFRFPQSGSFLLTSLFCRCSLSKFSLPRSCCVSFRISASQVSRGSILYSLRAICVGIKDFSFWKYSFNLFFIVIRYRFKKPSSVISSQYQMLLKEASYVFHSSFQFHSLLVLEALVFPVVLQYLQYQRLLFS